MVQFVSLALVQCLDNVENFCISVILAARFNLVPDGNYSCLGNVGEARGI
jgi:hypothetical protein